MDLSTVLNEVNTWPVEQQLELVYAVWDRVGESASDELPDDIKAELDRRLAAAEAMPDDVVSWEDVEQFARGES